MRTQMNDAPFEAKPNDPCYPYNTIYYWFDKKWTENSV